MKRYPIALLILLASPLGAQSLCPDPIVFRLRTPASPYSVLAGANLTVAQQDSNINAIEELLCKPNAITASHLKSVDAGADEECLTRETTTGDFEWQACGGGGAFIGLSDVPASYSGQGSKLVRVNAGATALEFTAPVVDTTCNDAGVTCLFAASASEGGPATTATALAANGANCAAASFPLGVDASGAVESCSTSISGNAATATALAANGANCSAGNYPRGVDAGGAAENCTAVPAAGAAGPGTTVVGAIAMWDNTIGTLLGTGVGTLSAAGVLAGLTQLNVDNLRFDGNTISSTNTNGSLLFDPDGTGATELVSGGLLFTGNAYLKPGAFVDQTFFAYAGLEARNAGNTAAVDLAANRLILGAPAANGNAVRHAFDGSGNMWNGSEFCI